jgi:hypothetical protein
MRLAIALLLAVLAAPGQAFAWGFDAHRFITDRAISMLPPELRTFFEARRAFIVEHTIDPDLWRNADFDQEPPNHFLDLDYSGYGAYPFDALPRSYDAAVQKFGLDVVRAQGLLPWRTQEMYGKLERSFAGLKGSTPSSYALDDVAFFSAIVAHYVADGHVPLHAIINYDGQLTQQNGVHTRWEAELFERYRDRLTIAPPPIAPVPNPRDFMFGVLLASNRYAPELLAADLKAAEGRELYDDAYFDAFSRASLPLVERRMSEAISAVASVIVAAWEEAGRPPMVVAPREPRRIKGR